MSDLFPTPTRLQLLDDVDKGDVFRDAAGDDYITGGRKVTAAMAELQAAGWVERPVHSRWWRLTSAGCLVLDGRER